MEKKSIYKFSAEELKKINAILPKGYKFITVDEFQKKESQRVVPKRRPPQPQPLQVITEPVYQPLPKVKIEKEEEYQPEIKIAIPPVSLPVQDQPAGSSLKLLERINKHPAYLHLSLYLKKNESDLSLRQIQEKANKLGEFYRIPDLETDLQNFFLMVYKNSVKTSSDYRQAAELDNHLLNLIKIEKGGDLKRTETRGGQGGRKRAPQVKVYQPLASYKVATTLQKRQLGMMIRKLSSENLQQVIYIMYQSSEVKEYTFDLDNIHIKKFRELEQYVKKCMQKNPDWDPRSIEDEQFSYETEQFVIDNDQ